MKRIANPAVRRDRCRTRARGRWSTVALGAGLLAGCAAGPPYEVPSAPTPAKFKEAPVAGDTWLPAAPADALDRGDWWTLFGDPDLDRLAAQVRVSNQNVAAAVAAYAQAQALVREQRAAFFPTLGLDASARRLGGRGNTTTGNAYQMSLAAAWEPDLWGRLRSSVEAANAGAAASQADLASARLSAQGELAIDYFSLREADAEIGLLRATVEGYERSLQITQNRYAAGVIAKTDVLQAQTQLANTRADLAALQGQRARLEHAIAVLIGKPPASFTLAPIKFNLRLPEIPPGMPSQLLERRPDVAAAERRMAQANARIGVAQAAYFPTLSLTGNGGFASSSLSTLFDVSSRTWSLGAGLGMTLLDFGARGAQVDITRAAYDEAVADYRQTVLDAFQEVEDNIATTHWLADEMRIQIEATRLARENVVLTTNQYKAGLVSFVNVALAQASQLNEERQAVILVGRRMSATVALIRAVGGTW